MTDPLRFFLVDVFATAPFTGNPLTVVPDSDGLDERTMRTIARELNQSETTFLMTPTRDAATWRLRSFTPAGYEVVGAGHNALGAWWWLAAAGRLDLAAGGGAFAQEIGDRVLPVAVLADHGQPRLVRMAQADRALGGAVSDRAVLARALGVTSRALVGEVEARVVSTGAPHLLVEARDRRRVEEARPDASRLATALQAVGAHGCYLYCRDPVASDATAYARFFDPRVGLWEDAATGSAAGALASQLVARGVVPDGATVVIEQGHAVGRPSRVEVQVRGRRVTLAGTCVVVAEGHLCV